MLAWDYSDMIGLDPTNVTHNFVVKEDVKLAFLNKKKIDKYHKASFIKPIDYSPWFSNIDPAMKPN